MELGDVSFKAQVDFYNALEKVGVDKLKQGNKQYDLVVANAKYKRSLLMRENLRMKLASKLSDLIEAYSNAKTVFILF